MRRGYRYNSTIQFYSYCSQVANFKKPPPPGFLTQAWDAIKQVPGAIGTAIGSTIQNAGVRAHDYGNTLTKIGKKKSDAFKLATGQATKRGGTFLKDAGQLLQDNAALTGGAVLGTGALATAAGANALMNRNKQPNQQPIMY